MKKRLDRLVQVRKRLDEGGEPACVEACRKNGREAIFVGDLNDPDSKVSKAKKEAEENDLLLVQLRADKNTKPRMWFAGPAPAEIEERIPKEGESFNNDTYNIYNWKTQPDE